MTPNTLAPRASRRHPARRWSPLAALALCTLVAACGDADDPSGAEVASLGTDVDDDGSDGGTAPTTTISLDDAMVEFTECMRDQGIDMADPQVAEGGGPGVIVASGEGGPSAGSPIDDEEFAAANEACKPILDAAAGDIEIDPEVLAQQREQMLDYAACMREHGVDMPDPQFGEDGSVSIIVGEEGDGGPVAGAGPGDEEFDAATEACSDILDMPGGGVVTGAGPSGPGEVSINSEEG